MFLRRILASTVVMTALVGAANAADVVFVDPPMAAPVEIVGIDWSGLYLGIHGGYGWADADAEFANGAAGALDMDLDGFFGGGQVGYNFVFGGGLLVGVAADYSFAGSDGSAVGNIGLGVTTVETEINSMASIRARLGYAMGQFLPYVTGGWAWADVDRSNSFTGQTASADFDGWTIGAGVEYAFAANWSAGFEYRYTDFGTERFDFSTVDSDVDLDLHTVSLRLNYRF